MRVSTRLKTKKEEVKKMRKGFTLIEVLVVAVIVAVLAAVAIPAYNGYIQSSKERVAKNTAGTIAAAIAAYVADWPGHSPLATYDVGGQVVDGQGVTIVQLPDDYGCTITNAVVTVTHVDKTASDSVTWVVG
ncbi:MAG: prepilin-type N-terminal cleavage/methylation domain-containing protein [Candidatus Delongbacteria bacterium]|nr:prepilin-type N-terminal cleavage/methylation domain-containing protein [Candidatus Delongbacteria bacterium]